VYMLEIGLPCAGARNGLWNAGTGGLDGGAACPFPFPFALPFAFPFTLPFVGAWVEAVERERARACAGGKTGSKSFGQFTGTAASSGRVGESGGPPDSETRDAVCDARGLLAERDLVDRRNIAGVDKEEGRLGQTVTTPSHATVVTTALLRRQSTQHSSFYKRSQPKMGF
jgi:hypothetical protein